MRLALLWAVLPTLALASSFPPPPEGIQAIENIDGHPGLSLSYKETHICEPKARAWSGYVHMPSTYLQDIQAGSEPYNISLFFWYFSARHSPANAPTAIYLAGGPGESSMFGAMSDGGPCTVNSDSNSTNPNLWSWNENVNMLYVDQPASTGFSYIGEPVNSTYDMLGATTESLADTGIKPFLEYNGSVPEENQHLYYGTFGSQSLAQTANTTAIAAMLLWHFSQVWFTHFPHKACNKKIGIWGNSYGGYFVPVAGAYMLSQNSKIANGTLKGKKLQVETVGWTNGCTDMLYQVGMYPDMAYNNTYGLQLIPEEVYVESKHNFSKPGGCKDLILECRRLGNLHDPEQFGSNDTVNAACLDATLYCATNVMSAFDDYSNRSDFDIAHQKPDPFPPYETAGFLNQQWVQRELGVPVNFTAEAFGVETIMIGGTGDPFRVAGLKSMRYLLKQGVNIALLYGDRDYRCPWLGAEQLALAAGGEKFEKAGYESLKVNLTYRGGVVRQKGGLAFARVFEAGHDLAAYQPETAAKLFERAMFGRDLATGEHAVDDCYSTKGPNSSLHIRSELPKAPATRCNIYNVAGSCSEAQYEALAANNATVEDFIVVDPPGTDGPLLFPGLSF